MDELDMEMGDAVRGPDEDVEEYSYHDDESNTIDD